MFVTDRHPACFECGKRFWSLEDFIAGGSCIICSNLFCAAHIRRRDGVPHCAACETERQRTESESSISQDDLNRLVRLLQRDISETIGSGYDADVVESATRIRLFYSGPPGEADLASFEQSVVDDVQQWLHDMFIDTSWPKCPDHPNHPLWFSNGWWECQATRRRVAPLGGLRGKAE